MLIITLPSTTWERAKYNNSPKLNRDTLKEIKKINKDNNKVLSTTIIVIFSMLALYFLFKAISTFSLL